MKKLLLPISYLLVIVATVLGTLVVTQTPSGLPAGTDKLQELDALLTQKFVDGVDSQTLQEAAAEAMVGALGDRWSYYIPADEYADYAQQKKNAYVGVGIIIQMTEEGCLVNKVTSGGSAEEAGMLAGDLVVAVDGISVVGLSVNDVKKLVQGKEGTSVSLTVLREGQTLKLNMERRTIQTPVATGTLLESGIGLVTIANFNTNCYKETMAAVESLRTQGAVALIFDVRFNGGGFKSELVKVLDDLLPEGPLFHSEYYTGATSVDKSDAACIEMPMAVLVNSESYSAAEFFAAALQEYGWAAVVGQKTQGKGHFQETFLLSDGSAVGLSTGRYRTPNGVDLEGVGITPDEIVEVDDETAAKIYAGTLAPMDDPQIVAAVNVLLSSKTNRSLP